VDALVVEDHVIYVALESTVKKEGLRLAGRISAALHEMEGGKADLSFSIASFPEEEADEDKFLSLAFSRGAV